MANCTGGVGGGRSSSRVPRRAGPTQIDDGLELRKAAFECLDILADCARDRLEPAPFLAALTSGLDDDADVRND